MVLLVQFLGCAWILVHAVEIQADESTAERSNDSMGSLVGTDQTVMVTADPIMVLKIHTPNDCV